MGKINMNKKGAKAMFTIYRAKDYQDMSRKAANIISAQIIMPSWSHRS